MRSRQVREQRGDLRAGHFKVPLKDDLLFFILSTRMMPPIAVAIPIYLMYRELGLTDTRRRRGPDHHPRPAPTCRNLQPDTVAPNLSRSPARLRRPTATAPARGAPTDQP